MHRLVVAIFQKPDLPPRRNAWHVEGKAQVPFCRARDESRHPSTPSPLSRPLYLDRQRRTLYERKKKERRKKKKKHNEKKRKATYIKPLK
jgi:hypothetical protein